MIDGSQLGISSVLAGVIVALTHVIEYLTKRRQKNGNGPRVEPSEFSLPAGNRSVGDWQKFYTDPDGEFQKAVKNSVIEALKELEEK